MRMLTTKYEKVRRYESPTVVTLYPQGEGIICGSPVPGGNESITYEDW